MTADRDEKRKCPERGVMKAIIKTKAEYGGELTLSISEVRWVWLDEVRRPGFHNLGRRRLAACMHDDPAEAVATRRS